MVKKAVKPTPAPAPIDEDEEAGRVLAVGLAGAALPQQPVLLSVAADLPLGRIFPSPLNPRRKRDDAALEELAGAIVEQGQLQPILVRPAPTPDGEPGRYEIICGARRHAAASLAVADGRLPQDWTMQVRIRNCDDDALVLLAATENLARKDMEPLDEAKVFAALLPRVQRQAGEEGPVAVARVLGTSPRTVYRRLQLLRLAPEIQAALDEGEINLGQASAFALGPVAEQKRHFKEMTNQRGNGWAAEIPQIRRQMLAERIPVERAAFAIEFYTAEIVEDAATGAQYFADAKAFDKLQAAAIEDWLGELRATWKWVDDLTGKNSYEGSRYESCKKTDGDAGAILIATQPHGKIELRAPVLRPATVNARAAQAARDRSAAPKGKAEAKPVKHLVADQVIAVRRAKTAALRRGLADDPKAAVAVVICGLLGFPDVKIPSAFAVLTTIDHGYKPPAWEKELLRTRLAAIAGAGDLGDAVSRGTPTSGTSQAALFRAMLELPLETLLGIQAALVTQRVGSWWRYDGKPAETELGAAIAEAVDAPAWLAGEWEPGEAYFKGYSRDRLVAIVRIHLGRPDANKLKKGELVALCGKLKHFWKPERFPELRFLAGDAMDKALDGPITVTIAPQLEGEEAAAE